LKGGKNRGNVLQQAKRVQDVNGSGTNRGAAQNSPGKKNMNTPQKRGISRNLGGYGMGIEKTPRRFAYPNWASRDTEDGQTMREGSSEESLGACQYNDRGQTFQYRAGLGKWHITKTWEAKRNGGLKATNALGKKDDWGVKSTTTR